MRAPFGARLGGAWSLLAHSLSGRLLLLTVLYVLASEVLIFVPAIGLYDRELLDDHILSAELAILPFTEPGGQDLSRNLREELLRHANADAVLLERPDQRELFLAGSTPARIDHTIDLTADSLTADMMNGLDCLLYGGNRTLHVIAPTRIPGAKTIGIVLNEASVRNSLLVYARRVIGAALFISLLSATLVFASLYFFLVRPMRRITHAMVAFRENPEDAGRILPVSHRAGEIGLAENELAAMQRELYGFLRQRARLAALGSAAARIQHDLRNILASAQLASDRLAASDDPTVKRLTPSLVVSIDRAIALATSMLKFGRSDEPPPQRAAVRLRDLVDEAAQTALEAASPADIRFDNHIARDIDVAADREQLFRVTLNLVRNAAEALSARDNGGVITVSATRVHDGVAIDVADDGPGIPETIRDKLFRPFVSAARVGGTGLGLAIARDLVRGHGGELSLISTSAQGTVFRVVIPDRS
ncbi:MAG: HAMP domain-containing histidine kinase [Alphaproteobacteria bacterium]|nr:HAMP domain-containing histidine kinase [Alphaproteobacteria bacterium]